MELALNQPWSNAILYHCVLAWPIMAFWHSSLSCLRRVLCSCMKFVLKRLLLCLCADSTQDAADTLMDGGNGEAEDKADERAGKGTEGGNGAEDAEEPELEPGEHRPVKRLRTAVESSDEGHKVSTSGWS